MRNNTCILLFSRTAASESKQKQLLVDDGANAQLHDVLYRRVVNTVSKSDLPVLKIDERQQVGNTFGERFYNAISYAFDQGFDSAIAVGSDCPSLRTVDIQYAHQELQFGRLCVGPSADGGVYLLAISKQFFNLSFKQLPWRTDVLAENLFDLLLGLNAQLTLLAKKLDVDNKTQLNTIAYFLKRQLGIAIPIFSHISLTQVPHLLRHHDRLHDNSLSRRGPPSYLKVA